MYTYACLRADVVYPINELRTCIVYPNMYGTEPIFPPHMYHTVTGMNASNVEVRRTVPKIDLLNGYPLTGLASRENQRLKIYGQETQSTKTK